MKQKIFYLSLILVFIFSSKVEARPIRDLIQKEIKPTIEAIKDEARPTIAAIREEARERLHQASTPAERQEIRNEIRQQNRGLLDRIKNQIKEKVQNLRFSARIFGKITEKRETFIKVDVNGKVYQVNINQKTQLRRKFWGKADLNEFSVGDEVNVIGRYVNEEKTVIEAILIRNLSIQRRWGAFFGKVITKEADKLIIETVKRGNQTVYFGNQTKFINRQGETIFYNDIQVGHRLRVKGVWDRNLSKIIEVEEIKDFSLPPLSKGL